ncbi:MAG: family 20 glycosylhydrolase [Planctomycetota bacterium]
MRPRTSRLAGGRGYRLIAGPSGVEIESADAAGERHARATLAQAIRLHEGRCAIPAFAIEDWPDFARRGVLLDVSRTKVPTTATLGRMIDLLGGWKYDELQLYTEHSFAYRAHEEVWRDASPITHDEARELDRRCRERGIELVPNQQSLGHMHRWLSRERYRHLAEVPDGIVHAFSREKEPFSLCPTDPAALELLAGLYDELLPCFQSRVMNVGLDETFDIGLGRSKSACEAKGKGRVYLDFLRAVHELARARGHRIQFWGDVILQHPELIEELPRDAVALLWGYDADHPFEREARAFAESGLEFRVCPGTSSWQSVAGRTANAVANLESAAVHGLERGASGYLVTDWGDRGHLQPPFASAAGLLYGAGCAWNASAARERAADLPRLLDAHVFHDPAGVLGQAAVDLGHVYEVPGSPSTNGSALFFVLAFADQPLPHARMPGLGVEGLERALGRTLEIRARLGAARGSTLDAEEIRFAADLLAFACRFGRARLEAPDGAPVTAIPRAARAALREELAPLAAEHRRLWVLRNRPGGLDESASWLERPLALLT